MTSQFEAQKKKVDAMPEVQEMMKMKGQMEAAVKEYDSAAPRMKAQLPKAKEAKFVAANKARREKKERDEKAKVKAAAEKKAKEEKLRKEKKAIQEKADKEKKAVGGASWSLLTGLF